MRARRKLEGLNLAFLDIMSCGLGAVILVFMLVKHQVNDSPVEHDNLEHDIQQIESIKQDVMQTLADVEAQLSDTAIQQTDKQRLVEDIRSAMDNRLNDIEKKTQEIEILKSDIKNIEVNKPEDLIEIKQQNEEDYLLGLKVEGPKIAILLDNSGSMTHEKLIDIIKTKNSATQDKQQADKWLRTKKIVAWLLARLPRQSDVVLVSFNEKSRTLGKQGWTAANDRAGLQAILADLAPLVPEGATNLQLGLQTVQKYAPSNLYLITDGLPTTGESNYKSLNPFSSCSSLSGNAKKISGACRIRLFQQTIAESTVKNAQINIILLPIEGDPDAINQYWQWSARTGGLVISPAANWP